ncbi:CinA family protein [Candidatus Phaeomarinobacter ectocarpi]|nr:CinA family protein [Candidatus Phaeomarinobacter ectocarpi]
MFPGPISKLAQLVLSDAQAKHLMVATAESCTGGLVAACLTDIAGSSAVVDAGFVTYSNEAKRGLLGVPGDMIADFGAVSEPVARAMAEGAISHSRADVSVSITGVAGPGGGTPMKPVGLVHFASARRDGRIMHDSHRFGDIGRTEVRMKAMEVALNMLLERIAE